MRIMAQVARGYTFDVNTVAGRSQSSGSAKKTPAKKFKKPNEKETIELVDVLCNPE
jgi:hypothetical protein